ncbi:MAG: BglG family transcription antiterminator [Coprobacillaceae bacterium]
MRELDILQDLYQTQDYLSIEFFMEKYAVSKRTIQSDISYLVGVSEAKGFHLLQKRGKGYLLEVFQTDTFSKWLKEMNEYVKDSMVSIDNVIAIIALQNKYITLDEIADWLGTSRSLIKKYKKQAESYLEYYHLQLESKAHYGVRIVESLSLRRDLLVALYMNKNQIITQQIDEVVENQFCMIEENLIDLLKQEHRIINYTELKELTIWLRVTIYIHLLLQTTKQQGPKHSLFHKIQSLYDVGYDVADIDIFEELILSNTRTQEMHTDYYNELTYVINAYLSQIDKQNNTKFNQDTDFKKLLITHISSLIDRSSFQISYKNPIIDELAIKYPMIFNMVINLSKILEDKFNITINKDEIGFIVTHFAVHMEKEIGYHFAKYSNTAIVCSSGGGSAYLIKLKIQTLFREANIETFSLLQMKELQMFHPDIVFSISELSIKLDVPLIYIKELLDDYDILRIKQLLMFNDIDNISISEGKSYFINRLFDSQFFSIESNINDYMECLKQMSWTLEDADIGGENYSQMVLQREKYASTIYINGVAIAHPIEMNANRDVISVTILKQPFIHENRQVSIIFMVALSKENIALHKEITSDLFDIMNDYALVQNIIKVNSYQEFIALINGRV